MKFQKVFNVLGKCHLWPAEGRFVREPGRVSREWFPVIRETGHIVRATGPPIRDSGRVVRETFPVTRETGPTVAKLAVSSAIWSRSPRSWPGRPRGWPHRPRAWPGRPRGGPGHPRRWEVGKIRQFGASARLKTAVSDKRAADLLGFCYADVINRRFSSAMMASCRSSSSVRSAARRWKIICICAE